MFLFVLFSKTYKNSSHLNGTYPYILSLQIKLLKLGPIEKG